MTRNITAKHKSRFARFGQLKSRWAKSKPAPNGRKRQGMNWIRQDKRLALYLRDGLACVWCCSGIEDAVVLTLDHVIPHIHGGSNHESNLVTACRKCNSSRGDRKAADFAQVAANYTQLSTSENILASIESKTAQKLTPFRREAKIMIARRGSCAKVINHMQ